MALKILQWPRANLGYFTAGPVVTHLLTLRGRQDQTETDPSPLRIGLGYYRPGPWLLVA